MQSIQPDSVAYNAQAVIRLSGPLDLAALQASLTHVVARHEVLRSRFFAPGGQLHCEVLDPWTVELPVLDLAVCPTRIATGASARRSKRWCAHRSPWTRSAWFAGA